MSYRTTWTPGQLTHEQEKNSVSYYCRILGHDIKHEWMLGEYSSTTTRYELRESLIFVCARCKSVVVDSELDVADKLLVENIVEDKLKELRDKQ